MGEVGGMPMGFLIAITMHTSSRSAPSNWFGYLFIYFGSDLFSGHTFILFFIL